MTLSARAFRANGRLASVVHRRGLSADGLLEAARRRTGLDDFGPDPVETPLRRLVESCEREADLSLFGRVSTRWDFVRLLTNRLILRQRERADPGIVSRPVDGPVVIMGLPRSGTSFLHALLSQDPANTAPQCWQTIYPVRDHPAHGRRSGPKQVQRQFDVFRWIAPEVRDLHPFDAHSPQECTEITAHSFSSQRFDITYDIPSYRRWLEQTGHAPAYHFHRRFLQHLQGERPTRWVLKSPDHVFAMDALRQVYPDARIVFVHRNPLEVLPSVAKLTEVLRRPFTRRVDRTRIGRQVAGDWAIGAGNILSAAGGQLWPADQVHHVHFRTLTADPMATVRRLYSAFGLPFSDSASARMESLIADKPNGGYGQNVYRWEDYGLRAEAERETFGHYIATFGV